MSKKPSLQSESLMEGLHRHCETCIKVNKCTVKPLVGDSCDIISCVAECGARFHRCKYFEHKLLCMNEKVPCINSVNGCPLWMPRKQLGSHLETCPASVVHCTMEWNRWPVCSKERLIHIPFSQPNPHVCVGQLDVALALRDQRMLYEWIKAPRKTRRALRNSLTRRYPAVPLQLKNSRDLENHDISNCSMQNFTDEEKGSPWEARKAPPGLKRSVCNELYKASKQTTESLSIALNLINYSLNAETKKEKNGYHISSMDEDKENISEISTVWNSADCHQEDKKNGCAEPMDMEQPDVKIDTEDCTHHMELESGLQSEVSSNCNVLFVDNTIVSEISSACMTDHARKQPSPSPPPPPSSPPLFINLGLDLTLESITRYKEKPKSMYTFLCAQEFRRDEYSWHYQNVHSDIHGGLNGWLEQRCPLAHYGCKFSLRRFFPTNQGCTIVHNDILESFGMKPEIPHVPYTHVAANRTLGNKSSLTCENPCHQNCLELTEDQESNKCLCPFSTKFIPNLTELPFEVLQHIARFLDSFSLCNLAMTSRRLREVCCSLLEERGIVVQQWEKKWKGSRSSWQISYKRWLFSTAFTPILWWGFEDKENMSNHLQKCTYFQRNIKTDPYYYPMQSAPNELVYERLKANLSGSPLSAEHQATKL